MPSTTYRRRVARVIVLGAGIGGLLAARAFAARGHSVLVVERDSDSAPEPAAAFEGWQRPGVPQVRQSHLLLCGLRRLLAERAPDLLQAALAAGAWELDLSAKGPPGAPADGDAELRPIAARRTTLEAALRRQALADGDLEMLSGNRVRGLLLEAGPVPQVKGVELLQGGPEPADLLIDAGGRNSPVPRWLTEAGVAWQETASDCGLVYYTRHFHRAQPPPSGPWLWGPGGEFAGGIAYASFPQDAGTYSVVLAVGAGDRQLQAAVREERGWETLARLHPGVASWLEASTALTGVLPMGSLRNLLRPLVVEGRPLALGVLPVGDSLATTNPVYGLGMTMAGIQAFAAADAFELADGDLGGLAVEFQRAVWPELVARFRYSDSGDRSRAELWAGGRPEPPEACPPGSLHFRRSVVIPASMRDRGVFRAVLRQALVLDPMDDFAASESLEHMIQLAREVQLPPTPGREEILAAAS